MPNVAAHALDRPDEKFREHRHDRGRDDQDGDGLSARPMFALFFQFTLGADEKMLMRLEREGEHADVGEKEHDGDA